MRSLRVWSSCVALLAATWLHADELPPQIRVVVPYTAGSSLDARARVIAEALGAVLKRRITVENRPGAGGSLGTQYVARSKADGSTLLFHNNSYAFNPHIYAASAYDPIRDFVPVAQAYTSGLVLVAHSSLGVGSVAELVALARSRSTPLSYASSGTGGLPHLAMESFKRAAGVDFLHVPYRGDGHALSDVLSGRVPLMMSGYPIVQSHVRAGTLRALAVTGSGRADIFPDVPTVAQAGYPGFAIDAWVGFFAPADTPPPVVERLNRAIATALASPRVQRQLAETGARPVVTSSADFAAFMRREWERYGAMIRDLGLKVE
ncbi:MAG TPA: tripartite tricarboxylate transporter substrate binding protein [Burkholderiales bacterium]|nr:tripartite tricarboxylate transporter substrate binding protein [Burkholderiales bacterium]